MLTEKLQEDLAALADGLRPVVAGGVEASGDPESFLLQLVAARRARD